MIENKTACGKPVEVRSFNDLVTVTTKFRPKIIHRDEKNIRFFSTARSDETDSSAAAKTVRLCILIIDPRAESVRRCSGILN